MEIIDQLKKFGLNQSEITVYIFLLQNGLSLPPLVSRETKIARTNCYNIFNTLIEKGLIEEKIDGKRKAYLAKSPESLIDMLDNQKNEAIKLLPDLQAMYAIERNKPVITYYSGWEGIRELFYQTFETTKIFFIGSLDIFKPTEAFLKYYLDELKVKEITFELISSSTTDKVSYETFSNLTINSFPQSNPQLPTAILVWGENVAFITPDNQPYATLLRNKSLSETFYTLFTTLKRV